MWRFRKDFVDVIDFRCSNGRSRASVSFGCGIRKFVKNHPKPWDCTFCVQSLEAWPRDLLEFKESTEEQVTALREFAPLFALEAHRWFALLADLKTARLAADRNTWSGHLHVAYFNVPSPAYEAAVEQLERALASEGSDGKEAS
jgi:hypothetical protein